MANHLGNEGLVKVGTVTIAEVVSYSLTVNAETPEDTALGDIWATVKAGGTKRWSGSLACHWDETDTTGQGALVAGTEVTLNLYPEGATAGDTYWTGAAVINSIEYSGSQDAVVSASFSFTGNGALTESVAV